MIQGSMGTFSSVKGSALSFACFSAVVMYFIAGAKTARVVYPRLLEERSSDGGMMLKVHDDLTLNLRKGSVAARELRVLTEENGRLVTRFYNGEDIERNLYEDEEKIASVMVTKTASGVHMEGLVSPTHRIKPMPVSEKSDDGVVPHEIHEIEHKQMLDKTLTYRSNASKGAASERALSSRVSVPAQVTVEVFVVLDTWHHRHFTSTKHALWYLCVMVNSANIRYRDASNPEVRLLLTGVEKAVEEDYVVSAKNDNGYLFDDGTIPKFRKYAVSKKTAYGHPDIVFLMTGRDVFTVYEGKVTDAGSGIGYVCGVCTDFYVGLGEDKPGLFSGTHTFTHEAAHLLGAKHDGDGPNEAMPGHPGAKSCSWDWGHIMSYINKGPSHHRFSTCTLAQIRFVLSRAGENCWKVLSKGTYVKNVYPGMAVTFQQFCAVMPYDKENSTYEYSTVNQTNCKVRCNFSKTHWYHGYSGLESYKVKFYYDGDALDYMPCGDHHVCIQGLCKDKRQNNYYPIGERNPTRTGERSDVFTRPLRNGR
ncbi:venom metalloproteinase antarease-like TtrivMP_A isoform X1 [Rhipicephalus sanguineus]|uniref:venom metalloproteinase antarease-like TtrivMP_A isoform X1 n=1 Tax=Rhipicephalus sanguineus TaxID=34632 RepID=UPI001895CD29|nr:venom metalloproteinase antarease-like TtrivMP_A isoform X1 [Rhipicephalus sanguineus]